VGEGLLKENIMREIKFRAWDKRNKEMVFNVAITWESNVIKHIPYNDSWMDTSLIPMQYTGLKDKNGKDIFEGDYLKCGKSICEIKYGHFNVFDPTVIDEYVDAIGFYFEDYIKSKTKEAFGKPYKSNPDWYEVVGNIYENPGLLNNG
jgi:uncharacterized phage protein (TIGR01671 family)